MGRPALIDRETVLTAAMGVADRHGVDALTMAAVAAELGVTAMALYRHVGSKADLLDGLVELLLTPAPDPDPGRPWPERLEGLARRLRATARAHPSVFPLLMQRPATTPAARRVRRAVYEALRQAGVADDRVAQVERLVSTAVLGFAVSEVSGRFGRHPRRRLDDDFDALLTMLAGFITSAIG